jgi:hypothetical protein
MRTLLLVPVYQMIGPLVDPSVARALSGAGSRKK